MWKNKIIKRFYKKCTVHLVDFLNTRNVRRITIFTKMKCKYVTLGKLNNTERGKGAYAGAGTLPQSYMYKNQTGQCIMFYVHPRCFEVPSTTNSVVFSPISTQHWNCHL